MYRIQVVGTFNTIFIYCINELTFLIISFLDSWNKIYSLYFIPLTLKNCENEKIMSICFTIKTTFVKHIVLISACYSVVFRLIMVSCVVANTEHLVIICGIYMH